MHRLFVLFLPTCCGLVNGGDRTVTAGLSMPTAVISNHSHQHAWREGGNRGMISLKSYNQVLSLENCIP